MPMLKRPPLALTLALAMASLAALAGPAAAGTLDVTVTDRDGQPAADVVVLLNVPGYASTKPAAAPIVIAQQDLRFQPFLSVVPPGSTLRFVNNDAYDHHVRTVPSGPLGSMAAVESFELRLDASKAPPPARSYGGSDDYNYNKPAPSKKSGTSTADVKVEHAGPIGLGCHIHGSMRGQVYVSASPFFAKTDAKGHAQIEGVPDGTAELLVWHPDQLSDQPPQKLELAGATAKAEAKLNFTPRRRRG